MVQRVVVIDDSEADRYLARRAFARAGVDVEVLEYDSAQTACNDFLEQERFYKAFGKTPPPILVLLDVNMPRMSGFDFLERLTEHRETVGSDVAVMVFTSSDNPADRTRALQFDLVVDFAVKPLNHEAILRVATRPEFTQRSTDPLD